MAYAGFIAGTAYAIHSTINGAPQSERQIYEMANVTLYCSNSMTDTEYTKIQRTNYMMAIRQYVLSRTSKQQVISIDAYHSLSM